MDKELLGKEIPGVTTRYDTNSKINENAEKEVAILEVVKKFHGIAPREIYSAIMKKEILCPRIGTVRLIDVQGWFQKHLAEQVSDTAPFWLKSLMWDGHGYINNVFSHEEISILDAQMVEVFDANKDKVGDRFVAFDRLTHTGELVLERVQQLWNSPLSWILGHPIFDVVANEIFHSTQWLPYVCMGLYKHPHSVKTLPHRDTHWCVPEIYRYPRFLFQIQFNAPEKGDGGLMYQPGSHFLQSDTKRMIQQGGSLETLIPCEGKTPYDVNLHNVGCLHGVYPNKSNMLVKRLYIGIIPMEELDIYRYYVPSLSVEEMQARVLQAKSEYKSLLS